MGQARGATHLAKGGCGKGTLSVPGPYPPRGDTITYVLFCTVGDRWWYRNVCATGRLLL